MPNILHRPQIYNTIMVHHTQHHHLTLLLLLIAICAPSPVWLKSACSDPPQVIRIEKGHKVTIDYWIGGEEDLQETSYQNLVGKHSIQATTTSTSEEDSTTPVNSPTEEYHTYLEELITQASLFTSEPELDGKAEADTQTTQTNENYFLYLTTEDSPEIPTTVPPDSEGLSEKSYFFASTGSDDNGQSTTKDVTVEREVVDTSTTFLDGRHEDTESSQEDSILTTISQLISTLSPFSTDAEVTDTQTEEIDGRAEEIVDKDLNVTSVPDIVNYDGIQGNLSERSSNPESNLTKTEETAEAEVTETYFLLYQEILGRSNETITNSTELLTDRSVIDPFPANSSTAEPDQIREGKIEDNSNLTLAKSLEDSLNISSEYHSEFYILEEGNLTGPAPKSLDISNTSSEPYELQEINVTVHEAKSFEDIANSSSEYQPEFYIFDEVNITQPAPKSLDSSNSSTDSYAFVEANDTGHIPKSLDESFNSSSVYSSDESNITTDHIPKYLQEAYQSSSELNSQSYILTEENETNPVLVNEETIINTQLLPKEESTTEDIPQDTTQDADTSPQQRPLSYRQPTPIFIRLHDSGRSLDKAGNGSSRVRFQPSPISFVPTFRSNNKRVVLRMLRQRPHVVQRTLRNQRSLINPDATSCEWLFKSKPGIPMLLTFRNFSTPQNPDCLRHYIAVERESNGFESRWCGPTADRPGHAAFAKSEIRIRLYSEGELNSLAGFSVEVQALDLTLLRKYAEVRRLIKNH